MLKVIFCLRRSPDLSREEFQRYWREHHAPLVQAHAEALGIRRYVQEHSIDDSISLLVAGERNPPAPFDGVAELWFDDLDALAATAATEEGRAAGAALLADERTFVDLPNSPFFITEEAVMVDGPTGA
ncbi:EthD domain-containing protein [Aquihabitans sp. McL0605]|uniref:EthD domain-containing protein n=1 Tax=Aquihabitans sp. McL0605 TaxID=3415671 RepID=UPI003CFBB72F